MTDEAKKQPEVPSKFVQLHWGEAGIVLFVNNAIAQFDGRSVFLTFGQAAPPVILGDTNEEKQSQLDKLESITVAPIIRLALTVEGYRDIVQVLQKHLGLVDNIVSRQKQT